jgi:hypothetical protein
MGMCRRSLVIGFLAFIIVGCDFSRGSRETSGLESTPQTLQANNGHVYTGVVQIGLQPFREPVDITLCLDHLNVLESISTDPGYLWLPSIFFQPPEEVHLSPNGTTFTPPPLPLGLYAGTYMYLGTGCASGKSIQVKNAQGSFYSNDPYILEFQGVSPMTPDTSVLLLETESLARALLPITSNSQIGPALPAQNEMFSAGQPFMGVAAKIPGIIEAENFDVGGDPMVYAFANASNPTGLYRPDPYFNIEPCSEGGYDLYGIEQDDYVTYTIDVPTGNLYTVGARVADPTGLGYFDIQLDGADLTGWIPTPNTGGAQNWTTVTKSGLYIPAGRHYLRLLGGNVGGITNEPTFSLNYLTVY